MKKTKDLFKGENIYYRDIDSVFPKKWEEREKGDVLYEDMESQMSFLEMTEEYLGTTPVLKPLTAGEVVLAIS